MSDADPITHDEHLQSYFDHIDAADRLREIAVELGREFRRDEVRKLVDQARQCLQVVLSTSDFLTVDP